MSEFKKVESVKELSERDLTAMRIGVAAKIREAEKAAYEYFCACPLGRERELAADVYETVRTAIRR